MNTRFLYVVTFVSILMWVFVESEPVDLFCICLSTLLIILAAISSIRRTNKKHDLALMFFNIAFVAAALFCRYQVSEKADAFSKGFVGTHACAPTFAELTSMSENWEKTSGHLQLTFRLLGASRKIDYQENGLFRVGFLDDKRAIWIPKCKSLPK